MVDGTSQFYFNTQFRQHTICIMSQQVTLQFLVRIYSPHHELEGCFANSSPHHELVGCFANSSWPKTVRFAGDQSLLYVNYLLHFKEAIFWSKPGEKVQKPLEETSKLMIFYQIEILPSSCELCVISSCLSCLSFQPRQIHLGMIE